MSTGEDWRGRVGREWAAQAAALEGMLAEPGAAALAAFAARPGERVLDLGCGAGRSSLALARAGAEVTGVDISPDLLAAARAAATQEPGLALRFIEADAATARFEAPFDGLFSRFGAMFFDDPAAAWRALHGAMAPGARLTVVCWRAGRENAWARLPVQVATAVLGAEDAAPSAPGAPGPFGWAEPAYFTPLLEGAGWRDVAWRPVDTTARLSLGEGTPVARALGFLRRIGPLARRLRESSDAERAAVEAALAERFAPLVAEDVVALPAAVWIVTARA
ncbi:methyltransferase domain-containing protein [Paroceanicella profunda]|uniref:Methyltransferase domain-containing protein n=1 Tax=Paroceanicella profunda TaxID=2579971 RepID=A0A5B8G1L4_9RHOB|nr:class I SAM-dependent methyltransferase [Paroceanicella profunda]QDL92982.1 methyltransferase domain-containing protein [Paroceanicella profunda]